MYFNLTSAYQFSSVLALNSLYASDTSKIMFYSYKLRQANDSLIKGTIIQEILATHAVLHFAALILLLLSINTAELWCLMHKSRLLVIMIGT